MRKKIGILILLVMSLSFVSCNKDKDIKEINISVAASLTDPMTEIVEKYSSNNTDVKISINSGGSGTLKKQISQGAEVGIFFSADEEYINNLIKEELVDEKNKSNPITNQLVLIKSNSSDNQIKSFSNLVESDVKIALGDINTVPVGKYAKESLENARVWDKIQDKIIFGNSVTAVKSYVERGEVDCGIIYKSDSINLKSSNVEIEISGDTHEKIIYSIAPIKGYKYEEQCKDIISFINSDESKDIFKKYGFTIME